MAMPRRLPLLLCSLAFVASDAVRMGHPFPTAVAPLPRRELDSRDLDDAAEVFLHMMGQINSGKHPDRIRHSAVSLISTILSHGHADDPGPGVAASTCHEQDALCNFLERMVADPAAIFNIVMSLYNAYDQGTKAQKESKYDEMFAAIQTHLWKAFDAGTTDEYKATAEYAAAKTAWDDNFVAMAAKAPAAAEQFAEGNATAWAEIMNMGIQTVEDVLVQGSPQLGDNVSFVTTVLQGAVTGWSQWSNGNYAAAVLGAWSAINSTLWQAELFNESSDLGKAMLLGDSTVQSIASAFSAYETRKANPQFCVKNFVTRASQSVSKCYYGFTYDANAVACLPSAQMGADCSVHCEAGAECTSFCPVDKSYCCMKGAAAQADQCRNSQYLDLQFTHGNSTDYHQCVSPAIAVTAGSLLQMEEKSRERPKTAAEMTRARLESRRSRSSLMETHSLAKAHATQKLETAFWSKSAAVTVRNGAAPIWGSHAPVCDPNSVYYQTIENMLGLCFETCPGGYEVVMGGTPEAPTETEQCKQMCQEPSGDINTDKLRYTEDTAFGYTGPGGELSWEVCGKIKAHVTQANSDTLDVIKDGITAAISAVELLSGGDTISPTVLKGYLDAFGDMVVHFSRPTCDFTIYGVTG